MSESELKQVYRLAEEHAEAGRGPREDFLPTHDGSVMVEGMEVSFHIDNSPAIYYEVGGADDLVYVDDTEGTGPVVSAESFVERVTEFAAEQRERFDA